MNTFYLSFGIGHPLYKYYIVIKCNDENEARNIANIQFARYGSIYSQDDWEHFMKLHGETMDVRYGWKLAATISDYKYANNYID